MVKALRLTAGIHDDETLPSYVGRLGALNYQPSTDDFCRDMGTTLQAVACGTTEAIDLISEVSGESTANLERAAFSRVHKHVLLFRGQTIANSIRSAKHLRFCASCLLNDIARAEADGIKRPDLKAFGRPQWHILAYRTCVKHNTPLHSVYVGPGLRQHDFAGVVQPLIDNLRTESSGLPTRQASDFERYLEQRLLHGSDHYLDTFGFSVVARFCELLGAVTQFGPRPPHQTFSDEVWQKAGAIGFQIASAGEEAINDAFSSLKRTDRDSRDEAHSDWGVLYDWMSDTRDPGLLPLLSLARTHIERNYPVSVGKTIFGERVKARKMHSIYTAAKEHRIHVQVLRTQLIGAGIVAADDPRLNNQILFDADSHRPFVERVSRGISPLHARKHINCERQNFAPLVDAGLLTPIAPVTSGYLLYDTNDLDAFVAALEANAVPYAEKPSDLETIPKARNKVMCSQPEIADLIIKGKLKRVGRLESETGYAAILVDPDEVAPLVRRGELGGIVITHIATDLGVPFAALAEMLNVHLPTEWRMHPQRRHLQQVVDDKVYADFKAKYVSLRDLSREAGVNGRRYEVQLREQGIEPEPNFPPRVNLYLRSKLR